MRESVIFSRNTVVRGYAVLGVVFRGEKLFLRRELDYNYWRINE